MDTHHARRARAYPESALLLGILLLSLPGAASGSDDLAVIKPDARSGFQNAGWKYDRYGDLQSLDAHSRIILADLKGPGVIRHVHTTRHQPKAALTRGIVLEIWFDGAEEPAVLCPLGDFFGDGCNGRSAYFSSKLIECAPWSYNGYFPMPFEKSARVALRNDTDVNAMNYSYVEWESLPSWDDRLGYFHATYRRKCFQLTRDSDETFFEVEGSGHVIGRQYSVVTEEPLFRGYNFVMEGNNEVDIDGDERRIDYLGTEDSFTFSWGFQEPFTGLRAGMPLVEHGDLNRLSIYRFHDAMPIRFNRSLRWHINWRHEKHFTVNPRWNEAVEAGGCWVDYATVHYWYQSKPGGFRHEPLPPVEKRRRTFLLADDVRLERILSSMEADPRLSVDFAAREDLSRVRILGAYPETHPFWIDRPEAKGGHPGNPNPGRQGILVVHPQDDETPCHVVRKVRLPSAKGCRVRVTVSGDPFEAPGRSDFLLEIGVHDGAALRWLGEHVIDAGSDPSEANWRTLEHEIEELATETPGIVVRVSYGGPKGVMNEEAFLDEISIATD